MGYNFLQNLIHKSGGAQVFISGIVELEIALTANHIPDLSDCSPMLVLIPIKSTIESQLTRNCVRMASSLSGLFIF